MKQDLSGHVLDKVTDQVFRLMTRLDALFPLGPTNVHMQPNEIKREAAKDGIGAGAFGDSLDPSDLLRIMQDAASNASPAGEQKIIAGSQETTKTGGIYEN